jgi:APA family basic amino acid/polyamine antiporter
MIKNNSSDPSLRSGALQRVLGVTSGIMLVAGIMIGSGIFKKIAPMAAAGLSEQAIIAAWVVAGIVTMLGAFTISGLAELTTASGGEYEYLRIVFGNFTAFIFGWSSFTIIGSASIAAIAFIFTQSINELIPIANPWAAWSHWSIGGLIFPFSNASIKCIACMMIVALTWVNYRGTKKGAILNNAVTYLKILGMVWLIVIGFYFAFSRESIHEAIVSTPLSFKTSFLGAFFAAMLSAFWAYDGWLNVSFVSGEIKNPTKNVPIAIITGVSLVMILYVLVNVAFMKVLPLSRLSSLTENDIAASVMAEMVMGSKGALFITVLILLSTFGALNGLIITYARLYYKMAQDGFFFKQVGNAHPRFHTPHIALFYSMVISCLLVFSGTFDMLTDLIVFAGFLFYALLAFGLIYMKQKGRIKGRLIGYPVVPVLFIIFSLALLINTCIEQPKQTFFGVLLMLSGIPLYYFFKRSRP